MTLGHLPSGPGLSFRPCEWGRVDQRPEPGRVQGSRAFTSPQGLLKCLGEHHGQVHTQSKTQDQILRAMATPSESSRPAAGRSPARGSSVPEDSRPPPRRRPTAKGQLLLQAAQTPPGPQGVPGSLHCTSRPNTARTGGTLPGRRGAPQDASLRPLGSSPKGALKDSGPGLPLRRRGGRDPRRTHHGRSHPQVPPRCLPDPSDSKHPQSRDFASRISLVSPKPSQGFLPRTPTPNRGFLWASPKPGLYLGSPKTSRSFPGPLAPPASPVPKPASTPSSASTTSSEPAMSPPSQPPTAACGTIRAFGGPRTRTQATPRRRG